MAAILAHQSQMAAFMAMNYMPQVTPDYMARYAAGMSTQGPSWDSALDHDNGETIVH